MGRIERVRWLGFGFNSSAKALIARAVADCRVNRASDRSDFDGGDIRLVSVFSLLAFLLLELLFLLVGVLFLCVCVFLWSRARFEGYP